MCVLKHFKNENAVPMRSGSFSTMGTAFPRVSPGNDPWSHLGLGLYCVNVHVCEGRRDLRERRMVLHRAAAAAAAAAVGA